MPFVATWMDLNITILSEIRKRKIRSSHRCSALMNPTSIYEDAGLIPALAQWIKDPMLLWAVVQVVDAARIWALLWLWCRLTAIGPIGLLAWELPYVAGIDLKRKKKRERKINTIWYSLHVESKIWHKQTYLGNKNRLTDIENRFVIAKRDRRIENLQIQFVCVCVYVCVCVCVYRLDKQGSTL